MYTFMLKEKLNREVTLSTFAVIAFILLIRDRVMDNTASSYSIPR
jgi:hypothetical protein